MEGTETDVPGRMQVLNNGWAVVSVHCRLQRDKESVILRLNRVSKDFILENTDFHTILTSKCVDSTVYTNPRTGETGHIKTYSFVLIALK